MFDSCGGKRVLGWAILAVEKTPKFHAGFQSFKK